MSEMSICIRSGRNPGSKTEGHDRSFPNMLVYIGYARRTLQS